MIFTPGWNESGQNIDPFDDVRTIQKSLESAGVALDVKADESSNGFANILLKDPDGNVTLIDQHR